MTSTFVNLNFHKKVEKLKSSINEVQKAFLRVQLVHILYTIFDKFII
jgi:hypothetical protein